MPPPEGPTPTFAERGLDADSRAWVTALDGHGSERDQAVARLHDLLLRAARFEIARRRTALAQVRGEELDDLAMQAADDALIAVLAKLGQYRGESRFTTWAYKFALLEASVRVRRRAWRDREVPLEPEAWERADDGALAPEAAVASSSPWRSTACRSTSSHNGSARREGLFTRPCTTRAASSALIWLAADSGSAASNWKEEVCDMNAHDRDESEPKLTGLLARVLGPVGPEVTCERCFDLLDEYVDVEIAGGDADARLPGMRSHLEGCPACREDYESLRDLAAAGTPHGA